jgi:hypothetical protein
MAEVKPEPLDYAPRETQGFRPPFGFGIASVSALALTLTIVLLMVQHILPTNLLWPMISSIIGTLFGIVGCFERRGRRLAIWGLVGNLLVLVIGAIGILVLIAALSSR